MTGASAVEGGIAAANLNALSSLSRISEAKNNILTVLSLLEQKSDRPKFLPDRVEFRGYQGNRFIFAVDLLRFALLHPKVLFIFDHVRLSLPLLPLSATKMVRTVIFAHGSEAWKRLSPTAQWSFRCASLCLTNSDFTLTKMKQRIPCLNVLSCPLGLSPRFTLNHEVVKPNGKICRLKAVDGRERALGPQMFLLVARMDSREGRKGYRPLIHVFPELLREFSDAQLVLAGPGDEQESLRQLVRTLGIASSVFIPGEVTQKMLESLYLACYAFVLPSLQEGFGLVYLEAMNYGKPCIGCWNQGAEDIIVHGQTGFLVKDPNNSEELLEVLRSLLGDPAQAAILGKNGFKRLHRLFTPRHHQDRVRERIEGFL